MRLSEWLMAIGLAAVLTVPALAQEQTGTLRISVKVPGTLAPVPGVQIRLSPLNEVSGETLLDLPDNEEDLLAYLEALAVARGIPANQLDPLARSGRITCSRAGTSPPNISSPSAVTDAEGNVTISNLKTGSYELVAGRDKYVGVLPPQSVSAAAPKTASMEVKVDSGIPVSQVSLFLNPAATVSGRIVDAKGGPVANACVQLVQTKPQTTGPEFIPGPRVITDIEGNFRFTYVGPGEYAIRAQAAQSDAVIGYFPGVIERAKAKTLTVEAGSDIVNIDFKLP